MTMSRVAPSPQMPVAARSGRLRARRRGAKAKARAGAVALALAALLAGPAAAERLTCAASEVTLTIEFDATAGRCAVDGRRASLQRAFDPVVCHIATPSLLIVTIARDGGFIWEDTGTGRVLRGACRPG